MFSWEFLKFFRRRILQKSREVLRIRVEQQKEQRKDKKKDQVSLLVQYFHVGTSWSQDVNWMYVRRSEEDIQDVFWTSYLLSIYVLCPGGIKVSNIAEINELFVTK